MEDSNQKQNKFQLFYAQLRSNFFNIMFELLKEKNTSNTQDDKIVIGTFVGCIIILIMFFQLIGLIFEPNVRIEV